MEGKSYSFEKKEMEGTLEFAEKTLSDAIKWDAKQIEQNHDRLSAIVQGHRDMSPSEHSYVITGQGEGLKLSRIKHPQIEARHLAAKVGELSDENLLMKMAAHGVETREELEPPKEDPDKPMAEMNIKDYQDYVQREEGKAQEKSFAPEIVPGMFGG